MYLPERHAFGGLVVLMQDRGLRRYYSTDMSLLQVRCSHVACSAAAACHPASTQQQTCWQVAHHTCGSMLRLQLLVVVMVLRCCCCYCRHICGSWVG
jgi:hypothetical protein